MGKEYISVQIYKIYFDLLSRSTIDHRRHTLVFILAAPSVPLNKLPLTVALPARRKL